VMAAAPQHTFQVLTKRHARMRAFLNRYTAGAALDPLPNVWLGVSVEDQHWADIRIPVLLDTPAAVRFLSCEPLLGPVDLLPKLPRLIELDDLLRPRIDWVIVGGESGPGARPMHREWVRLLRDQCQAACVPFLFKQWGAWQPQGLAAGYRTDPREHWGEVVDDGKHPEITWRQVYKRVGKKAAGRELDGRTWDEYPQAAA